MMLIRCYSFAKRRSRSYGLNGWVLSSEDKRIYCSNNTIKLWVFKLLESQEWSAADRLDLKGLRSHWRASKFLNNIFDGNFFIVLYLNIWIALLVGWAVQKRCQCAKSREKNRFWKNKGRRKTNRSIVTVCVENNGYTWLTAFSQFRKKCRDSWTLTLTP